MKVLLALMLSTAAFAQQPFELARRMEQLMESTAVAVPDLVRASESLRIQTAGTVSSMKESPANFAFPYRLIFEVRAYLALSDAYLKPGIPAVATQQFTELRDDLSVFQQTFETGLKSQAESAQAAAADPANLHGYAEANSKLPPAGIVPRVVFLGDSITEAWRLSEFFSGRDFINRGVSGQTTIQLLGRFLQDVAGPHPKAVVVLGGINDIARGVSQQSVEYNLAMIGDLAKAHGIKAIFGSILPTRTLPVENIRQLNHWLQDYCRRENFGYIDYFTALADATGQLPADLSEDGLHPNARGYRIMSPMALEAINKALEATPAAPPTPPRKRFALPVIK